MKTYELLRMCADKLEMYDDVSHPLYELRSSCEPGLILTHPRWSTGRFPFIGGGTEVLSATQERTNYSVPVYRVLSFIAKQLKAEAKE